jgi:NhaP-type Na+/H+ and K+/H+ antiporter
VKHSVKIIIFAATLVGAIVGSTNAMIPSKSSFPWLNFAVVGDFLTGLGLLALKGDIVATSKYTPLLLAPGLLLSIGCRAVMIHNAQGHSNKIYALTAALTSLAGSVAMLAGTTALVAQAEHDRALFNTAFFTPDQFENGELLAFGIFGLTLGTSLTVTSGAIAP